MERKLNTLTVAEVQLLLESHGLTQYQSVFNDLLVDGAMLNEIECIEDMKDVGIDDEEVAENLYKDLMEYKKNGVSLDLSVLTLDTNIVSSLENIDFLRKSNFSINKIQISSRNTVFLQKIQLTLGKMCFYRRNRPF